jgi:hypothetical protein
VKQGMVASTMKTLFCLYILFIAVALLYDSSNPILLGFSAAGSVRESVLFCALSGQTRLSCNAKQATNADTVSNRVISTHTRRGGP